MTYRSITAGLLLAGLVFWLTALATAADGRPGRADRHAKMLERHPEADTNKDGQLSDEEVKGFFKNRKPPRDGIGPGGPGQGWHGGKSRAEMAKELLEAHPELDTNKDGEISREERKAGRETIETFMRTKMSAKILAAHPNADTDGDGKLSEEEFAAFRRGGPGPGHPGFSPPKMVQWLIDHFDKVDANGDGQLSKEELTKFKDNMPKFGPPGHKGFGAQKRQGAEDGDKGKGKGKGQDRGRGYKHRKDKSKGADKDSDEK